MKKQRRHHTVTRFYLSGFASKDDQIRRTALNDPDRPHNISIRDASVQTDFYMVEDKDGTFDDRVEKALGKLENESAKSFHTLLGGRDWPLSAETRAGVAAWIALQHLRGPSQRQMINDVANSLLKLQIIVGGREGMKVALNQSRVDQAGDEEIDDAFAKYSDPSAFQVEMSPNEHIKMMLKELPGVAFSMYVRPWSLVGFQHKKLATCDHPVVLVPAEDTSFLGVGTLSAGGIYVPLDRHTALVMGDLPNDPERVKVGAEDVRFGGNALLANTFNRMLVRNAREAIFTHPDDGHLTQGPLPSPRRQEIVPPDYEQWRGTGEKFRSRKAGPS